MTVPSAKLEAASLPSPGERDRPLAGRSARAALAALRPALCLAAAAGGLGLAWQGGPAGLVGAGLLAAAAAWIVRSRHSAVSHAASGIHPRADAHASAAGQAGAKGGHNRIGAEVMVAAVVPVWHRQLLASRDAADQGLTRLLESFHGFSGALDTLAEQMGQAAITAQPGAVDAALQTEHPALAALLAPTRRAFAQRDAVVAELGVCRDGLSQMQQHAKHARELARHTRLVAFNASIEAQRDGSGKESGSQAVASEVRMLAGRMAEVAGEIDRLVERLQSSAGMAHRSAEIGDTSSDELELELELRAREASSALVAALGASLQGANSIQASSADLRAQIEEACVHFQFGDRISQMLAIVANDMQSLADWLRKHPYATQSDAAAWLDALENSYTMEEQRSQHHGNVHVAGQSVAEFF